MVSSASLTKIRRTALILSAIVGAGPAAYSVGDHLAYEQSREDESLAVGRAAGIRIETPEVAYIELFYFSMYLYMAVQTLALATMFRGVDWRLFRYEDNPILKLLFWPVLLSIWFAFTLARFY